MWGLGLFRASPNLEQTPDPGMLEGSLGRRGGGGFRRSFGRVGDLGHRQDQGGLIVGDLASWAYSGFRKA